VYLPSFGSKDKYCAIDGLQYVEDSTIFYVSMGNQDVYGLKGSELKAKIVFLVN